MKKYINILLAIYKKAEVVISHSCNESGESKVMNSKAREPSCCKRKEEKNPKPPLYS